MDPSPGAIGRGRAIGQLFPGLAIVFAIAVVAIMLQRLPGLSMLSPLMLAVMVGMAFGHICRLPAQCQAGIGFSGRRILRFAVVLLGLHLSVKQILAIGVDGVAIGAFVVASGFAAIVWIGSLIGVDARLAGLLAAGTSICGASAVAAMSAVNRASEEDVTYAMAGVTVFGTILMFLLPVAGHALGLSQREFGIWAGASIHEIAQVTGAAFQYGDAAGDIGIIVKLTRVVMLAPLVIVVGMWFRTRRMASAEQAPPAFPLFVIGFVAAAALNSIFPIAADIRAGLMSITTFLMAMALAALGLQAHAGRLRAKGMRPLALGAFGTVLIVVLSLGLVLAAKYLV